MFGIQGDRKKKEELKQMLQAEERLELSRSEALHKIEECLLI